MESFNVGKYIFLISYLILEILTVILIITTFPILAEYASNPPVVEELTVLIGILFFYAVICLIEVSYSFSIQQGDSKRLFITLAITFLLNIISIIIIFEYANLSVLRGSNLGFILYKTYYYIFIPINIIGFGANLYLLNKR
jgi:hypothetical protein